VSRIVPTVVVCPRCGAQSPARLFESLNGDRIPAQVDAILDGNFERTTCGRCSAEFQPEHHMLLARHSARQWIVMYPFHARDSYAQLERGVTEVLARNFADAPAAVAAQLREIRPRLVFGQGGLTEALRSARDAIDPPLLECAKLLAYRRSLPELFALGPTELVYERRDAERLVFGVSRWPGGEPLGELAIAATLLAETQQLLPRFGLSHRELFERPYVSALRYLHGA
jgi:hypothetical protein